MEALKDQSPKIKRTQLVYKRPYEDHWGALHDPTTWWDELLKYYQHNVRLIVSEATRKKAQPAWVGAQKLIREEQKRHKQTLARVDKLEADYLQAVGRRKHWQRRKSRLNKVRAASYQGAPAAQQR